MPLLVATRKGLFTLDDGGRVVDSAFLGVPVSAVCPAPRGLFVALNHGHYGAKVHHRQGEAWVEVSAPVFPEGEGSLEQIWTLVCDNNGVLWAGTLPVGLWRSEDGGQTWQRNQALWDLPGRPKWFGGGFDGAGVHTILFHPDDARRMTVGISCGGVWHSQDGGESWVSGCKGLRAAYVPPERVEDPDAQDPHRMARCTAHPDRVWMQHHNGVFRSDDGGHVWTELQAPPNGFGFGVAAHPHDPDTAWFVPGDGDGNRAAVDGAVAALRTRDGGQSWELLREGLPQEHAYDLVYRHALDVDATGSRVAFGSTTGNLFVSEDGGDSWSAWSHHLPPIYAVCWT